MGELTFSRDFDRHRGINEGVGPDMTFARTEWATYWRQGVHQVAPHNLLLYSDTHNGVSPWTTVSGAVTVNDVAGYNGRLADKFVTVAATSTHRLRQDVSAHYDDDRDFVYSGVFKPNGYNFILFDPEPLAGSESVEIDLRDGTVSNDNSTYGITWEDLGDGWSRITVSFNCGNGTPASNRFTMYSEEAIGSANFEADGVSGFYVMESQLNRGRYRLPYVDTEATIVEEPRTLGTIYDGANHIVRGLLMEGAATNLVETTDTNISDWGVIRMSKDVSLKETFGLIGTTLGDTVTTDNTHIFLDDIAMTNGVEYTFSFYVRPDSTSAASIPYIYFSTNAVTGTPRSYVDIQDSALGTVGAGHSIVITPAGPDGLILVECTFTVNEATGNKACQIQMALGDNDNAFVGDGTRQMHFYEPQLEASGRATSRIIGSKLNYVRVAETLSGAFVPTATTTIYVEGVTSHTAGVMFQIDDTTENERYRVEWDGADIIVTVTDGGVEQAAINAGAVAEHTFFRLAIRIEAADYSASLDGAAVVTDGAGTLPTLTTLRIGGDTAAGEEWGGYIGKMRIWDEGKADAELVLLSNQGVAATVVRTPVGMGIGV